MRKLIMALATSLIFLGVVYADNEGDSLVLSFDEIQLPKATQDFNNAKNKLIKARKMAEEYETLLTQKYETRCQNSRFCVNSTKYLGYYGWDEYTEWRLGKKVSPEKKQKFEQLEKAIDQFYKDMDKRSKLGEAVKFATHDLAKAEYYKTIAQIKQSDEEKAREKYDETITYLSSYERIKQDSLAYDKEQKQIQAQRDKLEKQLNQVDRELERAKYNKLQAELENLPSLEYRDFDINGAYEKITSVLDRLVNEL